LLSDAEGAQLVRLARSAVEKCIGESVLMEPTEQNSHRAGVFVTLNYVTKFKEEHLRGCIGFPMPEPLHQSVIQAAVAAATQDPRFPPVDMAELENIAFEVSVLTLPEELKCSPADYGARILVGRDGLMLRWRHGSGLLLPQVPVELKWDVEEYLANICYKAGAPLDALREPSSKLYTFQALVFKELEPRGKVVRL
jgi:uncharacterized protein (TIGR00296 family)